MVNLWTLRQPKVPLQQLAFQPHPQPPLQQRQQQPPLTMAPVRMGGTTLGMDATKLSQTSKNLFANLRIIICLSLLLDNYQLVM